MSRHPLFRVALVTLLATALPAVSGCSSDASPAAAPALDTSDVVREGVVTEGQLRAVLANAPIEWAWAGGSFDTPLDTATVPSGAPFEFTWQSDQTEDPPAAGAPNDLDMVHLLVFSTPSKPKLLRVFTSLDSYTPDAAAWQTLNDVGEGEVITLSLTSATLIGDGLTGNGGPFIGQQLTFSIE